MMIPVVSPCHHVHQCAAKLAHGIAAVARMDSTPTVAATVEAIATNPTNLNTSSPRSKRRGTPMKCRISDAPTTASSVLPVPMNSAASTDD